MREAIQPPTSRPLGVQPPRLTVETGLYAVVLVLALGVRLYRLGLAPLAASEAQLALAAWRGNLPPAGASPLLTWLTAGLFAMFGSSGAVYSGAAYSGAEYGDALARLMPALIGTALVALPMLVRDRLGRVGALGAAAVLAISPVAIMTSRTVSGDTLAAAVMLGLAAVSVRYLTDERPGWLYAGAALLGWGLASGSTFYSALATLAACAGLIAALDPAQARERWQAVRNTPKTLQVALIILAAVFLSGATAFAWKPAGLSATGESLSAWVAGFSLIFADWAWPVKILAVYESLALVAGVIGLIVALQRGWTRRDHFSTSLLAWFGIALVLAVARSGQGHAVARNADALLTVIPLALLGGQALQTLADSFRVVRGGREEAVLILILLPVMAYLILGVAGYATNVSAGAAPNAPFNLGPAAQLVQSFLALALAIVIISLFGALSGTEIALRGTTLALLIAFALMTWAAGWGAAQLHPGDPRELVAGAEATSPDVRDLTSDLAKLSADKTGDATTLAFAVQGAPDGVLGWYLRGWPHAGFAPRLDGPTIPSVFITTDQPPTLSTSYAGQRYTLSHAWRAEGQSPIALLKWLIYRKADLPQPTQQVVLWVKQ